MIPFNPTSLVEEHMQRTGYTLFDMVGILPQMLSEDDQRDAVAQLHEGYAHGGGWHDFEGFKFDAARVRLTYPGDPPMRAIAIAHLRDEMIVLFESAWVAVVQPNGDFRVARMD